MNRIGLLTYHSAYNYGSALQAYATQQAIASLGYDVEMINYRMAEQSYFYKKLYHFRYGGKSLVRDLMQIPMQKKRIKRAREFEDFFEKYYNMTSEMSEPEEVFAMWNRYDCIVSGSDQIWNKDSIEFRHNDIKYMDPYLLKGFNGKKVSYASSVGTLDKEKLDKILPAIGEFEAISFREKQSSDHVSDKLGKKVVNVLDPTFLLDKEQWIDALGLKKKEEDYILYYSLANYKDEVREAKYLKALADRFGCRVVVITPLNYAPVKDRVIEYRPDYGPRDFLELIYNAKLVVTYSYHGTILSVNMGKPFYSLAKKTSSDYRKKDILGRISLEDRIAYGLEDVLERGLPDTDYAIANGMIEKYRNESYDFLSSSIGL